MAAFLRNHWYVAAWSAEIDRDLTGRVLLGDTVCLYRAEDGTPVALENRCAHRNLPLSEGRLVGDAVECGYHGMVFDCDGVCTHVPGMETPPDWARVRRYPVAERNGWLFIWMGEADDAYENLVPDFQERIPDPDWLKVSGHLTVGCGYRLILDNLLDLSHLTYVHSSTTGNAALAPKKPASPPRPGAIAFKWCAAPGIFRRHPPTPNMAASRGASIAGR